MKIQYDEIANQYTDASEKCPDRNLILIPSAKHYLGNIQGHKVLDLACGSGFFTRPLQEWGASQVVGVDISEKMIEIARNRENTLKQGITYFRADVANLELPPNLPQIYDSIFAGFLLHYSQDVSTLEKMCASIAKHLKPGGRFVAINENPEVIDHGGIKYGIEKIALDPPSDGSRVKLVSYDRNGHPEVEFVHFHFRKSTYERALSKAGFTKIEWLPFVLDPSVTDPKERHYWDDFLYRFSVTVLRCQLG